MCAPARRASRSICGYSKSLLSKESSRGSVNLLSVFTSSDTDARSALVEMSWQISATWQRFATLDLHTEGEPLRILIDGLAPIPGTTILERRRYAEQHLDGLRRLLMLEPRGHADMYGAIVTPPASPNGDLGVLFMHNEGWSTMCGHGIIALVTACWRRARALQLSPTWIANGWRPRASYALTRRLSPDRKSVV